MKYSTSFVWSLLFVFSMGLGGVQASEQAPSETAPISVYTEMVLPAGVRRTAQVGDIIHEDRRILSTQIISVANDVVDECNNGWCHNFTAGTELVYVGYGPRIYCSPEKTGQRDTMFSDYPSFSCVVRDQQTGVPNKIFGLKEFSESLRIDAKNLPRSIRVNVADQVLEAYPDWAVKRNLTFIDGIFRVRFAGVENGRVLLDLEHEPAIQGSQPALVRRITYPLNHDKNLPLPFVQPDTDYENLIEKRVRLTAADYSGVSLEIHGSTTTSLDYETEFETKLLQIFPTGYWQVSTGGRSVETRSRYR